MAFGSTRQSIPLKIQKSQLVAMLKLTITNNDPYIGSEIAQLSNTQVKSRLYYPGFDHWFSKQFIPGLSNGERDVISVRDKRYETLVGFCLLKKGVENKICNLSPLLDGVGITQVLLDSSLMYFNNDFTIDVPLRTDTIKLHHKLKSLGFVVSCENQSSDHTTQLTYIKPQNIGWV